MSRATERTFVKRISLISSGEATITLLDTSGNLLPCTHILVKCITDGLNFGTYWVHPASGQGGYFDVTSASTQLINTTATSKGAGGTGGVTNGEAELHFDTNNPMTQIRIVNNLEETAIFLIQYGNPKRENPIADRNQLNGV